MSLMNFKQNKSKMNHTQKYYSKKTLKLKNKMKILKVARGKWLVTSEGSPGRLKPDLSS